MAHSPLLGIDRHEVDRVRDTEPVRAVAGDAPGRTVLSQPAAPERQIQHHRSSAGRLGHHLGRHRATVRDRAEADVESAGSAPTSQ